MKQNLKRLLPVSIVIGITIIVSFLLYYKVMDREKERCWQTLGDSAKTISAEFQMKFQDNIITLGLAANAMVQEDKLKPEQIGSFHLDAFEENTIFSRIDVLYPDNTILYEDGRQDSLREDVDFNDIAALGEHISHRLTDVITGNESFYYYIPVKKNGEIQAILTGVIDTTDLADIFQFSLYDGHAAICLVDSADGNYVLDTWHPTLGNAYDTPDRTQLKGYEDVDLKSEIKALKTGVIAFESNTNGKDSYMYYTPVGLFDWELLSVAQEDVVFSSLLYLKKLMIFVGIIELLLLALYIIWNLYTVEQLAKSEKGIKEQQALLQAMSYHDMLTYLYNRNKYIEVLDSYKSKIIEKVGAAYIDLNGLKQINDNQGHEAGDTFIRTVAKVLSGIFPENSYRIGGDEFVVMTADLEEADFQDKIIRLQKEMQENQVSISIGSLWKESCSDLEEMMKEADHRMYEAKKAYYQKADRRTHSH